MRIAGPSSVEPFEMPDNSRELIAEREQFTLARRLGANKGAFHALAR
jgi:hypothetical protein